MLTKELKQQVVDLRKEGKTYNEIHNLTGVAKSSISDICKPLCLGNPSVKELTSELIEEAQKLYNEIGNINKVAKIIGIGYQRLSKCIQLKTSNNVTKSEAVISWRKRTKQKLIDYKGGKCHYCGYDKCIEALEFHHLDPNQKDFQISGTSKSFDNLKQEADKCVLVCANCHREIHAGIINC